MAAIKEAATMTDTDTDTVASMVGALAGILHGKTFIPLHFKNDVQDSNFLLQLPFSIINTNLEYAPTKYKMYVKNKNDFNKNSISSPIGNLKLIDTKEYTSYSVVVSQKKYTTEFGQTIYLKNVKSKAIDVMENPRMENAEATTKIGTYHLEELKSVLQNSRITANKLINIALEVKSGSITSEKIAQKYKLDKDLAKKLYNFFQ